jgi:hypothetical protein
VRLFDVPISLGKEQKELIIHVRHVTMTDDQLAYIEQFYAKIRTGIDNAEFNAKHQIIQLLDIRAKVVYEKSERFLFLKCLINPPE